MKITEITQRFSSGNKALANQDKFIVRYIINGEPGAFCVYRSELSRFGLEKEKEVPNEIYETLCRDVLIPRAKNRAQYLLEQRDYTVFAMKKKLFAGYYPAPVINSVISFLEEYGMLNDELYIRKYLETYSSIKSAAAIRFSLISKGLDKHLVDCMLAERAEGDYPALYTLCEKRLKSSDLTNFSEFKKQLRFFLSKGFSRDDVIKELRRRSESNAD